MSEIPLNLSEGDVLSLVSPKGESMYFEVSGVLGEGGGGVVYASVTDDGRPAVVKAPRWIGRRDAGIAREARLLQRLPGHPNLIELLGVQQDPRGHELLVLERAFPNPLDVLSRPEVRARLDPRQDPGGRYAPVPVPLALELAFELAAALEHLHDHKLVHCDVKPDNLMVRLDLSDPEPSEHEYFKQLARGAWRGVLIDLGGARTFKELRDASAGVRGAPLPAVTPVYAPPEVLPGAYDPESGRERSRFSPWMDTYAFGLTVYQLLTGAAPYAHLAAEHQLGGAERPLAEVAAVKREERDGAFLPLAKAEVEAIDWSDVTLHDDPQGRYRDRRAIVERVWELLARTVHYEPSRRGTMKRMREDLSELLGITAAAPSPEVSPAVARPWTQGRLVLDSFASRLVQAGRDGSLPKAELKKIRRGSEDFWEMQGFKPTDRGE